MAATASSIGGPTGKIASRRDFLFLATGAVATVGAVATCWPLIDQMNPDAATLASGGPIDVDVGSLAPGQQVVVSWQSHPVFIVHRPPPAIEQLRNPALLARLKDPDSTARQQPKYADNWHRSLTPEYLVLVGVCTHLGCIPEFKPKTSDLPSAANWPGGYFCPCHGSKYDLAGRVFNGVPAPYNLPVPPYHFARDKIIRVGENPPGQVFDFSGIVQL